jgi:beta-phosphoglucomutase-like phosphatase (HAD superfamily)
VTIRALLFDFDGLLVDTETTGRQAWEELYAEHGHALPRERWATLVGTIGAPWDPLGHLEELLGEPIDREAVQARLRERSNTLCDLEQLRPGVEEYFVEAERRGLLTGVVSSSHTWWVERHLHRLERLEGLDLIVAANGDLARRKPLPVLYEEALERLGLEPEEAIAFEDSHHGVRAAKDAGLFCVAVPNPVTASFEFDGADLVVESLAELPLTELLERATIQSHD